MMAPPTPPIAAPAAAPPARPVARPPMTAPVPAPIRAPVAVFSSRAVQAPREPAARATMMSFFMALVLALRRRREGLPRLLGLGRLSPGHGPTRSGQPPQRDGNGPSPAASTNRVGKGSG